MADETVPQALKYRVRENRRAKRIILRVTVTHGLEVVIPSAAARRQIPEVLAKNRAWIEHALKKLCDEQVVARRELQTPPTMIALPAVAETWTITREHVVGARPRLEERAHQHLHLCTDLRDSGWQTLLRTWLITRAQKAFSAWLKQLSERTQLGYARITVRVQRTRWGSCSRNGNISLNARLLFVAPEIATYVLLHELCHTQELNHSIRFWRLVERFEPNWRKLDRALTEASRTLPRWAM
ncbi:MAG: M48 family metallopeptidase [Verrucomicrobia bacterium]|nr:M48 family metallopeptidase [Verrucomicrobiota bacterium]